MPSYTEILFVTVIMNMGGCCCCSHLKMIHFTWQLQSTIQRNRTGEPAAVHSTVPHSAPFFWVQSQNTGGTILTSITAGHDRSRRGGPWDCDYGGSLLPVTSGHVATYGPRPSHPGDRLLGRRRSRLQSALRTESTMALRVVRRTAVRVAAPCSLGDRSRPAPVLGDAARARSRSARATEAVLVHAAAMRPPPEPKHPMAVGHKPSLLHELAPGGCWCQRRQRLLPCPHGRAAFEHAGQPVNPN